MAFAEATHDMLPDQTLDEVVDETPARPSERYQIGGRDTVIVVWAALAALVSAFFLTLAAANMVPTTQSSSTEAPAAQP